MKANELRELTDVELHDKVRVCEEELFNLRFKAVVTPLPNPHRVKILKKDIARCWTILRERRKE